ncbi:dual 3',5'-cyclic-AMP and -GMP phosphodiesterase 11-like isoform X4 [Daphnia carinata]|uniref:dual 3',5'-cyclic-AMP and -GMP phosphodiesterase 11-like isoform X4 n=1 Tax=Daphnia carinata TaxID=120202 RepID=UPI0025811511|nr:dual 3',5'-cyclic-AMP and -GMP phosphodiesterase 11-like isoform X4 [Daphnia carinata]
MIETQRGRISEGSKLAMINSGISRSSASMDIPSPPVSWTTRRQTAGTAASRGGEDSSLTKGNSGDHHVGYSRPATPSAPGGTNLQNSAAGSYSSFCGITGSTGSSALAPAAPSAGGGPIAGPTSYRDHNEQSGSGEWDLKKWNEERERDRETWINDPEWLRVESWIDEHPNFCLDYFLRKATRQMVDAWLVSHSLPSGGAGAASGGSTETESGSSTSGQQQQPGIGSSGKTSSGMATPVRKISAHEFERGGLLRPLISNVDGTLTFISPSTSEETHALINHSIKPFRRNRHELKSLDEKELIFELVKDICNDLDVRSLCHKILQNVSILTKADRCSLFLVQGERGSDSRCLVSKLFDVCSQSTLKEMEKKEEIRIPWGSGIVGYVAQSGEPVNIPDAYKDERFNHDVDVMTGYHTRSMLCLPIKDSNNEVIGVAQVINKQGDYEATFTATDSRVFAGYLQFCGIGLKNAQLYERSQLEIKRNQVLLDLARMIFEEQSTLEIMVYRILTHTQSLIQCQRCQVLLVHEASKGTFSRVFDFEASDLSGEDQEGSGTSPNESRFPINVGITSYVATTAETVNIIDAYKDTRFDPSVDEGTDFVHKTVLCMPIKNSDGYTIGVIQLVNKFNNLPFTKNDENFVEAFSIFCGMGINNTNMYEKAIVAMAKQRVTLEVLSYHATAPAEDATKLKKAIVPSAKAYRLHDYRFNDFSLEDEETLKACLRMFLDLDLIGRFHIDYEVLCRWLLSVKKNYRNVTYHNWRHAFNVAQMMFAIVTGTQWWKVLGEIEVLSLIMACLCHDLDHRGTNNSFQVKASSPLAQLYTTSTMERHHFDQCLMILSSQGCQILSNVTSIEYTKIIKVLEEAILSTDLAVYFGKRGAFFQLVSSRSYDWWQDSHRELLRGMMMTACDVAAITKPWEVQWKVADLVANEFFEQGDIERRELNITPIDMMNREKKDQLPAMQVGFIDSICLPVYDAFSAVDEKLTPLLDGVHSNRKNWQSLADSYNKRLQDQKEAMQEQKRKLEHQQSAAQQTQQRNGQISPVEA